MNDKLGEVRRSSEPSIFKKKKKGTNVKLESWHYQTSLGSMVSVGPATEAKKRMKSRMKTWFSYGTK